MCHSQHVASGWLVLLDCCFLELTCMSGMTCSDDDGPVVRIPSLAVELFHHGGSPFRPAIPADVNIDGAPCRSSSSVLKSEATITPILQSMLETLE